jgi:hypothetical protein
VRATTILLPLLGLTYVLVITSPGKDHISVSIYVYFNAVLQSTQGLVVAICYCFVNGEVRGHGGVGSGYSVPSKSAFVCS